MSDIKLFRTSGKTVEEMEGRSVALEKSLQTLIETHLDVFLGIRFLATEHSTGKTHAGRIDTLGIDENGCPCIIEYKRAGNQNVINQGLYYLDWLMDHKAEFQLLVLKTLGQEAADEIEWASPRLVCIAGDFTKYDAHAVQQMNRNIELIRYVRYGEEFLLFDLVNAVQAAPVECDEPQPKPSRSGPRNPDREVDDQLAEAPPELVDLFEELKSTCLSFGDDVQLRSLKRYFAFRRIKNFVCVGVRVGAGGNRNELLCWLKVDPDGVKLEKGFSRDVRDIGHAGTGDLEITIHNSDDIAKALPLLRSSYEAS
jgi:predicted transport protein